MSNISVGTQDQPGQPGAASFANKRLQNEQLSYRGHTINVLVAGTVDQQEETDTLFLNSNIETDDGKKQLSEETINGSFEYNNGKFMTTDGRKLIGTSDFVDYKDKVFKEAGNVVDGNNNDNGDQEDDSAPVQGDEDVSGDKAKDETNQDSNGNGGQNQESSGSSTDNNNTSTTLSSSNDWVQNQLRFDSQGMTTPLPGTRNFESNEGIQIPPIKDWNISRVTSPLNRYSPIWVPAAFAAIFFLTIHQAGLTPVLFRMESFKENYERRFPEVKQGKPDRSSEENQNNQPQQRRQRRVRLRRVRRQPEPEEEEEEDPDVLDVEE